MNAKKKKEINRRQLSINEISVEKIFIQKLLKILLIGIANHDKFFSTINNSIPLDGNNMIEVNNKRTVNSHKIFLWQNVFNIFKAK